MITMSFYIKCGKCHHVQRAISHAKYARYPADIYGQLRQCSKCKGTIELNDNSWVNKLGVVVNEHDA